MSFPPKSLPAVPNATTHQWRIHGDASRPWNTPLEVKTKKIPIIYDFRYGSASLLARLMGQYWFTR